MPSVYHGFHAGQGLHLLDRRAGAPSAIDIEYISPEASCFRAYHLLLPAISFFFLALVLQDAQFR